MSSKRVALLLLAGSLLFPLAGCGKASSSSSVSVSSSVDPNAPIDITGPAETYRQSTIDDASIMNICSQVEKTSVFDLPAQSISYYKNLLETASISEEEASIIHTLLYTLPLSANQSYSTQKASFTLGLNKFQSLLDSLSGDQLGYVLAGFVPGFHRRSDNNLLIGFRYYGGLTSLDDYNLAASLFTDSDTQAKLAIEKSYFDGSVNYFGSYGDEMSKQDAAVFGRALSYVAKVLLNSLSQDDLYFLSYLFASKFLFPSQAKSDTSFQSALSSFYANPAPFLNNLGAALLKINLSVSSWELVHDSLLALIKNILSLQKDVPYLEKVSEFDYLSLLLSQIEEKKNVITGFCLSSFIKLLGYLGTSFDASILAAMKGEGEKPDDVMNAYFTVAIGHLSLLEKTALSTLLNNLGIDVDAVGAEISSWGNLNYEDEASQQKVADYINSLFLSVKHKVFPTLPTTRFAVSLKKFDVLENYVFTKDDFVLASSGETVADLTKYEIAEISASTSALGHQEGTLKVKGIDGDFASTYHFAYSVHQSFEGIAKDQYISSTISANPPVTIGATSISIPDEMTASQLQAALAGHFTFTDKDGSRLNVATNDTALSYTIGLTEKEDTFLLLKYKVSETSSLQGLVRLTKING
jgi:hypothetical protein